MALSVARGTLTGVVAQTRSALALAQRISSTVKSVKFDADEVQVSLTPQRIDVRRPLVRIPMGDVDLGLQTELAIDRVDQSYVLSLQLDTHLLDSDPDVRRGHHGGNSGNGGTVAKSSYRLSGRLHVELHQLMDGEAISSSANTTPKRLTKR